MTRGGRPRPATPDDVDRIARALPEVELGISWGDRPTYLVRGKGFVLYRKPHRSAVDPGTGEPYDDLLVIRTATHADSLALVEDDRSPFFTVPHLDGYNAVLVQQSRLDEIGVDELEEVLVDAWAARAPRSLVARHLGAG